MSRAHDGQWTFLPFGNPFRGIFPRRSYLSPKLQSLLHSFEQDLTESLRKLMPKEKEDVLSLAWLRHAIESLSATHTSIKTLITDLKFPVTDWDEKWIDMYLDDSIKLLDICIALSSEMSILDQGQLLLRYILHALDSSNSFPSIENVKKTHASLHDWMHWMQQISSKNSKLEACSAILQGLASSLSLGKVRNSPKGKVLMGALYGVKAETIFVCSVFITALSSCSKPLMELHVPDKFLWAEAFNDLQACVNGEIKSLCSAGNFALPKEVRIVKTCVEKVHSLTTIVCNENEELTNGICHEESPIVERNEALQVDGRLQEAVSELAKSANELAGGLDLLSKQVSSFFQIVLTGRDALLCNLRVSDVAMESNVDYSMM